ncbi:MAG: hypothetical protein IBJ17_14250 [Reyranella sp.]|nr:hypothetical protein [Reyranella sp.]
MSARAMLAIAAAAELRRDGYEIGAGRPRGPSFRKGKDADFCNSGRTLEGAMPCLSLQNPKSGAACDP